MNKRFAWILLAVVGIGCVVGIKLFRLDKIYKNHAANTNSCEEQGYVDSPGIDNSALNVKIKGWAFDSKSPVSSISLTTRDKELILHKEFLARPDVKRVHPQCENTDAPGFEFSFSVGALPPDTNQVTAWAHLKNGKVFKIQDIAVDQSAPLIQIESSSPIGRYAKNIINGWVAHPKGVVKIRLMAGDVVLWAGEAGNPRDDVGAALFSWPMAKRSGFEFVLEPGRFPLMDGATTFEFTTPTGKKYLQPGPRLENHGAIGKVLADEGGIFVRPKLLHINAWAWHPSKVLSAKLETEQGISIAVLQLNKEKALLSEFKDHRFPPEVTRLGVDPQGSIFSIALHGEKIPVGLQRLMVRVRDGEGNDALLPGPLVWNAPSAMMRKTPCPGLKYQVFLPGVDTASKASAHFESLQRLLSGSCVILGLQTRIEYLRTTRGKSQDFVFDPDFPETIRKPSAELEMTTASLNSALKMAITYGVPINLVMDGGVWADSKYSIPDYDVVDWLEQDEQTVQWNQFGRSESDGALKSLAGSQKDPELARMMSLNRYNTRFMNYKKRNLQAAIRRIVEHNAKYKYAQASINLDPDEYINPWFINKQWYDYNPGTIRQFREWLMHTGPYADGAELVKSRSIRRFNLADINKISGKSWHAVEDIDPPREKAVYGDAWHDLWIKFKRHLVAQHYDDLARWAHEAGLPAEQIRTSQTFLDSKVATYIDEPAQTWSDEAGVSIEGAKPEFGHLGAIFYGPGSRNEGSPRMGESLLDNVRSIDSQWGVVEFHPGNISTPYNLVSHDEAYKTLLTLLSYGASRLTPMWGSSAGDYLVHPEHFRSYDVFDQSPFETQLAWWMHTLRYQPRGGIVWPFGNEWVQSDDGWTVIDGTVLSFPVFGKVRMQPNRNETGVLGIRSPALHLRGKTWQLKVSGNWRNAHMRAEFLLDNGKTIELNLNPGGNMVFDQPQERFLTRLTLRWAGQKNVRVELDDVRLTPLDRHSVGETKDSNLHQ